MSEWELRDGWRVGAWSEEGSPDEYRHEDPSIVELTVEGLRLVRKCKSDGERFVPEYVFEHGEYHPDHYLKIGSWLEVSQFLGLDDNPTLNSNAEKLPLVERMKKKNPGWSGPGADDTTSYNPRYGDNWSERRQEVVDRDDGACRLCGIELEVSELDVHHIKPARTFESIEDGMNDLDNLVTLCPSCHGVYEGRHPETTADEFVETIRE